MKPTADKPLTTYRLPVTAYVTAKTQEQAEAALDAWLQVLRGMQVSVGEAIAIELGRGSQP